MRRDQWAKAAKNGGDVVGVANLVLLILVEPSAATLALAIVLAPLTLAVALRMTATLACNSVSLALGNRHERAELVVSGIAVMQPPRAGDNYRETILAEIRTAPADQMRAIVNDLLIAAPRTILTAWVRVPRLPWRRRARR